MIEQEKQILTPIEKTVETNGHAASANGVGSDGVERLETWLDYLTVFVKWRRFILINTFVAGIVALTITFFLPKWYTASATILIPAENDLLGLGKLLSGGLADGLLGKSKSGDVDTYEAIFKSERLRLEIINRFNLRKIYEFDKPNEPEPIKNTLNAVDKDIAFKDNKDGTIMITATFKEDSVKAAEMTNFIVSRLDSINRTLLTENARYQRQFVQKRYEQAQLEMRISEQNLNDFQKQYKVAEVRDQMRASLEASAQMEAAAIESEVEYNVLRRNLGETNPEVIQAREKTMELRRQVKRFETGGLASDMIIPFSKMPDLGMQYVRLYREVLLQTKILEFLVPQYEQAKIQEAKDTPTVLVLDKARVPEWKSKPKRLTIIAMALGVALLISFAIAVAVELIGISRRSKPEVFVRLTRLYRDILIGVPFLSKSLGRGV